jgi:cellulose synthase/poly-beta-1,6-N-acetylglucosamine synthase-like glycosyltransferase
MNVGLPYVTGELTLITDGDIRIQSDIFEKSARHFSDPDVGAVVGYASIEKTGKSPLEGFIDFEFFSSQELNRRGFNVLGVHFIIPGGMSVFRSGIIEYMGGYPPDTLAEDTDLSFNIAMRSGKDVHYDTGVRVVSIEPMKLREGKPPGHGQAQRQGRQAQVRSRSHCGLSLLACLHNPSSGLPALGRRNNPGHDLVP